METNSMIWRIYKYTNTITGQSYIGQTTMNVNKRAGYGKGYTQGTPFREAIDKYGWDKFEQSILRLCTSQEEADQYERYFIEKYNSVYPNGYNLQSGGKKGNHVPEETRQKMSDAKKGVISGDKNPMYGKHHKEESKKKIADAKKGKHLTEEHRQKISNSKKEAMTDEVREKIANARKGTHWFNDGTKNVAAYECPEGFIEGMLKK